MICLNNKSGYDIDLMISGKIVNLPNDGLYYFSPGLVVEQNQNIPGIIYNFCRIIPALLNNSGEFHIIPDYMNSLTEFILHSRLSLEKYQKEMSVYDNIISNKRSNDNEKKYVH